jgi:hypothetical protein
MSPQHRPIPLALYPHPPLPPRVEPASSDFPPSEPSSGCVSIWRRAPIHVRKSLVIILSLLFSTGCSETVRTSPSEERASSRLRQRRRPNAVAQRRSKQNSSTLNQQGAGLTITLSPGTSNYSPVHTNSVNVSENII